jgi:vang-like
MPCLPFQVECDGLLISFGFKLFILLAGSWAVFLRHPKATLPRIYLYRSLVCFILAILVFSFWLFYSVKIIGGEEQRRVQYVEIVQFATSLADALIFVHYLAVLLIEIRHSTPQ